MIVLCTGPESSGTRLLSRIVSSLGVEAIHRSIPHADKWWDAPKWYDRAIFINRDPWITEISALEANHIDNCGWTGKDREYPYRLTHAWEVFYSYNRRPWIPVTYEGLVQRPQHTLDGIARWLGVNSATVPEEIRDPRSNI